MSENEKPKSVDMESVRLGVLEAHRLNSRVPVTPESIRREAERLMSANLGNHGGHRVRLHWQDGRVTEERHRKLPGNFLAVMVDPPGVDLAAVETWEEFKALEFRVAKFVQYNSPWGTTTDYWEK
jgi:hypothetical protein